MHRKTLGKVNGRDNPLRRRRGDLCFPNYPDQPPQEVTIEELRAGPRQEQGFVWLHVNSSLEAGRKLVRQLPELPTDISEELLDGSDQMHFCQTEQGCLLTLRVSSMNPTPITSR